MGTIWSQTFISLFYCLAPWWRKCWSGPWAVWIVSEAASIRFLGRASRPDECVCMGGSWTDKRKLTHSVESVPLFEGCCCLLARQEHQLKKQNTPLHRNPPFCLFYKGIFQWLVIGHLIKGVFFFFFLLNLHQVFISLLFSVNSPPSLFSHPIPCLCSVLLSFSVAAPSRRGDLEVLGYCLLHWQCGTLPWLSMLRNPVQVQEAKAKYARFPFPSSFTGPETAVVMWPLITGLQLLWLFIAQCSLNCFVQC